MKNLVFALVGILLITAVIAAETYNGLQLAPSEFRERHLSHFLNLVKDYCIGQTSKASVTRKIVASGGFTTTEEYDDVYEQFYDGISYAVSPEPEYCTVDVMIEYEEGKLLFSLEDIIGGIESISHYKISESSDEKVEGNSSEKISIKRQYYKEDGKSGQKLELEYPLDHQDEYFMTVSYYY